LGNCGQSQRVQNNDLPKAETILIKKLSEINDKISSQNNVVGEKEVTDSATVQILNFIKTDLNCKVENWRGYISKIRKALITETIEDNVYDVNIFIPLNGSYDKEHPNVDAITLICQVKEENKKLMQVVKSLKPFDKVSVSGIFSKNGNGDIEFADAPIPDKYNLSSPEFIIQADDISKL